jgi:hypothetical protein
MVRQKRGSLLSIIRFLASFNVLLVKEVIDRFLDLWDFWREFGLCTSAWPVARELGSLQRSEQ